MVFQRQVNWILWSVVSETALVVIPEEAELIYPVLRDAKDSVTHLLTYAAPVTRKMSLFNKLEYYAVPNLPTGWRAPTWLTIELGIFAGRLYFEFEEYGELCNYLGFGTEPSEKLDVPGTDGAADDEFDKATIAREAPSFTANPLTFIHEWLAVRRKGQDFNHTPMGMVCQGKPLTAKHPFFTRIENDSVPRANTVGVRNGEGNADVGSDDDAASETEALEDDEYFDEGQDD